MLKYSINTWPTTKRMPIVTLETIGYALNASLSKEQTTNVTAVVS